LKELAQYCADNPQYLTVVDTKSVNSMMLNFKGNLPLDSLDEETIKSAVLSIQQGLANVEDIISPLELIKERLSRSVIIKSQKKEL
jgi:hypothetical protein